MLEIFSTPSRESIAFLAKKPMVQSYYVIALMTKILYVFTIKAGWIVEWPTQAKPEL
jgi:hypothetical protein